MTRPSRMLRYFPILPLVLFTFLSIGSGIQESGTFDEPGHLASGYRYWVTGKYALDLAHPPFLRLWASFPLLFAHLEPPALPNNGPAKNLAVISSNWLYHNRISGIAILNTARIMMVFWGVFLGLLVWRWAWEIGGALAAAIAVVFYSFNPSFLANTPLMTTDMGAAGFSVLSLYLFWKFWERPTRLMALLAGIGYGLALSAKFSALLLPPIFISVVLILSLQDRINRQRLNVDFVLRLFYMGLAAGIVLLAFYRFSEWQRMAAGIWEVFFTHSLHPHFFAGHIYDGSPKWFFLALLFIKTPLPFLLALLISALWAIRTPFPQTRFVTVWVLIPCCVYLACASTSTFQSGIRRILFLYPMLSIWLGIVCAAFWSSSLLWRVAWIVLSLWYVAVGLAVYPDYLAYVSEIVGGRARGYQYVLDCNLDWGQGFGALGHYLQNRGINNIYLSPFGTADPHTYGIRYVPIAPVPAVFFPGDRIDFRKEKVALFAISATNRGGIYYDNRETFGWLDSRRPVAILAHSIWVYDVTRDAEAHRHFAKLLARDGLQEMARQESAW